MRQKIWKFFLYFIGLLILLTALWNFFPWDMNEINDKDLALEAPTVFADSDNAYILIHEVLAEYPDLLAAEEKPVRRNILDDLIQSTEVSGYGCYEPDRIDCELIDARDVGQLFITQSALAYESGDVAFAAELYEASLQLAIFITEQPRLMLIDYLIALAIIGLAEKEAVEGRIGMDIVSSAQQKFSVSDDVLIKAFMSEYNNLKDITLDALKDARVTYWLQPNRAMNELAKITRLQVEFVESGCQSTDSKDLEHQVSKYHSSNIMTPLNLIGPNFKGDIMLSVVVAGLAGVKEKHCAAQAFLEG